MKKRTLGIIIGGKSYSLTKADYEVVRVAPVTKGRDHKYSLANSNQNTAAIITELMQTGEITESQTKVILAFEEKIVAITNVQNSVNTDKQRLTRHVSELQADLLKFLQGENMEQFFASHAY